MGKITADKFIDILNIMDQLTISKNSNEINLLRIKFYQLTNFDFDAQLEQQFYKIINKNTVRSDNKTCMCDILFFCKKIIYLCGLFLLMIMIFFKTDNKYNQITKYIFVDSLTSISGCLILYFITSTNKKLFNNANSLICFIWFVATIYHNNIIIASMVTILLFYMCGFCVYFNGIRYHSSFNNNNSFYVCILLSIVLNYAMIIIKTKMIIKYFLIFETSIFCWTLLINITAMYVLCTGQYAKNKYYVIAFIHKLLLVHYFGLIMIGKIYSVRHYQIIGYIFYVLWLLESRNFIYNYCYQILGIIFYVLGIIELRIFLMNILGTDIFVTII